MGLPVFDQEGRTRGWQGEATSRPDRESECLLGHTGRLFSLDIRLLYRIIH